VAAVPEKGPPLQKEKEMRSAIAIVMTLAVASLFGCQTSPRGGSTVENEGFKIGVPAFTTEVKQGELQTVTVSLNRDSLFKQDVTLHIKAAKGISVEPTSVTIKASDKPDVQLQIAAPKDAALGEYPVVVKGTPETGEPTSVGFTVKVVAP
jgi:uncharacterized membrane protein